ncbi:HAD-IA family hydrolase [Limosilactobacillus reuteri]|jgi:HAD superfamily hydrolase (TIGR01549 family)|uniref:HAD family hydrolase n=4 Tax=Limosilactobacillus reuteri TaxID=1598 RepID=A0A143Q087_LIMRT|nr:HAD-IA family hydrolase [Limosilactobacillus reuteri]AMY14405.1 HAD family hydrolase [Limosilactobacillus reuteri]MCC4340525.1 HAD family hydrolase [Limosilactobacillus reuteri]MCC4346245.1 HAD family hydrolase [Limosilactobacillus reuteri]MCC4350689.1 HAD family hydrolase [Limosilactobacillus reuteri]MCC4360583.1 HAD family hydrolase [Limosilactobacillus reuteri]
MNKMAQKIENFIFDIDGTLIDTIDMYMPAMIDTLAQHGHPVAPDKVEQTKHDLFGITGRDALRLAGISEEEIPEMLKDWFDLAYQRADRAKVIEGIPEMLNTLANREDAKIAIATSKLADEYQEYFVNKYDFAKLFKVAITSADTKKHKPAPDPILAAMDKMGADPATTVYVGDTINDMKAAHAAGAKFAGALYSSANPDSIKDADFPLMKPADLLKI